MNMLMWITGCTALFGAAVWCFAQGTASPPPAQDAKPGGIAVVELFSSEGCSSCPPADDLLAALDREAAAKHEKVYFVAMHVDYWDSLGWKDPFASPDATKRQRTYAPLLAANGGDSGSVYTPQMVVNGAVGFVGSDETKAREAIAKALREPDRVSINATVADRKVGEPIHISASCTGDTQDTVLVAALVESGLSADVKRGENSGRTLKHDRVARIFVQSPVKGGKAALDLEPPAGVKESNCTVLVFAQDSKTMHVLGGTEVSLATAPAK